MFVHEVGGRLLFLRSVTEPSERSAAMAGVFDIDLDQPEENVSDDENEEVLLTEDVARDCESCHGRNSPREVTRAASQLAR